MKQADVKAILTEVRNLKTELKEFMSGHTTELEKQNLEAHVDLCSERYKGLHDRLSAIEVSSRQDERGHAVRTEVIKDNNHNDRRHSDSGTTFDHGGSLDQDAHPIIN